MKPTWPGGPPTFVRTVIVGLLPVVLTLFLLLGLANYLTARRQILEGVQLELDTIAAQGGDDLAAFFARRREDAIYLADASLIRDYQKNKDYGLTQEAEAYRDELSRYLSRFAARAEIYSRVAYVDAGGRELAAGTPQGPGALRSGRLLPPGKALPGQVRHSGFAGDRSSIDFTIGVFDEGERQRGSLMLTCDLRPVMRLLNAVQVGREGRAFLIDSRGRELLGARPSFGGGMTAEAAVGGTPWRIRLLAKPGEFLAPLARVQRWTFLFSLLACALVVLWIGLWVRSAVLPLRRLAEGTRRFAAGDLDFQFELPAIHELRTLGAAFNDMARSLGERTRDLEERVRELTSLRDMESAVLQRMDEETILRVGLESASKGLSLERVGLYWVDEERREIVGRYTYGSDRMGLREDAWRRRHVALGGDDILNQVVRTRQPVLFNDTHDPRLNPDYVQEAKTREFVMAPVCGKDRVFGVLTADNYYGSRPLGERDKESLSLFANALGLALENVTLLRDLSRSEARYRAVLENSPVAVVGLSREHWVTTWSRGAAEMFGYGAEEMTGKPLSALLPAGSERNMQALLAELMEKGSVRDVEVPGKTKDGRRLDLSLSWGGTHRDFWLNNEWTVVIRDVSDARRMQHRLINSEKLAAVGQLISGIAHELNNPLQAVVGYAQLLEGSGARAGEDLKMILDNAMRCRKIIDNLLLFVRQGEVNKRVIRVDEAARASIELLNYKLKKAAAIRFEVKISRGLPKVKADMQQLEQVFVNLINNACDAMADSPGRKELRLEARAVEGRVRVEVQDSGPGVPEAVQARLFEPLFTTKGEGRGTGLGLTVCRQIIEDHGGRIGFVSRPGHGATFWIELPAAKEEDARPAPKPRAAPRRRGASILVVDDEPAVLAFLREALEADGCRPELAASLEEAFKLAALKPFDLVIADIRLGAGSGLGLFDAWSSRSPHPRPGFLFLTGDVLDLELERSLKARSLEVLHKPVELEELWRAARGLLAAARRASP